MGNDAELTAASFVKPSAGYDPSGRVLQLLFNNDLVNDDGADGINGGSTSTTDYLGRANKSRDFTPQDFIRVPDYTNIQNIFNGAGTAAIKLKFDAFGDGRIFQKGSGNELVIFSDSGKLNIFRIFSGANGSWRTTANVFTLGVNCTVLISWDDSDPANNPLVWIDDVSKPVTRTGSPSGSATSDAGHDLYIGNRSAADRGFDGKEHDVVFYNKILSAAERTAIHTSTP